MLIPIKKVSDTNDPNSDTGSTHLKVSIIHLRERKRVIVDVTPIKKEGTVESFMLCSGSSRVVEDMPRKNQKRLDALEKMAEDQVNNKSGQAWDLVKIVMEKHGFDLAQ